MGDKDGKLSLTELTQLQMSDEKPEDDEKASLLEEEAHRKEEKVKIEEDFKAQDKDGDGFLESAEISSLLQHVGAASDFKWDSFDSDKDGKPSLTELLELALDRSEEEEDDEEEEKASLLEEGSEEEGDAEDEDG